MNIKANSSEIYNARFEGKRMNMNGVLQGEILPRRHCNVAVLNEMPARINTQCSINRDYT